MSILENLERLKSAILSKDWDSVAEAYYFITGESIGHIEADTETYKERQWLNKPVKKRGRPKKTTTQKLIDDFQLPEKPRKIEKPVQTVTTVKKESRSEPVRFKGNTFVDDGKLHSDERGSITGIAKVDAKLKKTWKKEKARSAYKPLVIECSSEKCKETLEIDPGLYYSESNHYCNKCLSKKRTGNE